MTDIARVDYTTVSPVTGLVGADTLKYLGLDPAKPEVHALVMLCRRYRLDPLLGHASVIAAKGGNKAYITRDGMLEIAHRSGQLDGIVVDEQRESENGWSATVSVWRKDMAHPFTYRGGCGKTESQGQQGNGAEMALARAERRALRRAFAIPAYDGDDVDEDTGEIQPSPAEVVPAGSSVPPEARRPASARRTTQSQPSSAATGSASGGTANPATTFSDGTPMFDPQTGKPL